MVEANVLSVVRDVEAVCVAVDDDVDVAGQWLDTRGEGADRGVVAGQRHRLAAHVLQTGVSRVGAPPRERFARARAGRVANLDLLAVFPEPVLVARLDDDALALEPEFVGDARGELANVRLLLVDERVDRRASHPPAVADDPPALAVVVRVDAIDVREPPARPELAEARRGQVRVDPVHAVRRSREQRLLPDRVRPCVHRRPWPSADPTRP